MNGPSTELKSCKFTTNCLITLTQINQATTNRVRILYSGDNCRDNVTGVSTFTGSFTPTTQMQSTAADPSDTSLFAPVYDTGIPWSGLAGT